MDQTSEKKAFILTIDDDEINNMLLGAILEEEYEVVSILSGEKAIEFLKGRKPDLILLDLNMPGMNGFQVLEYLKQNNNGGRLSVIYIYFPMTFIISGFFNLIISIQHDYSWSILNCFLFFHKSVGHNYNHISGLGPAGC